MLEYTDNHRNVGEPFLINITCQVLSRIAFLHHRHIVHRDINPSNLRIDSAHRIKIADFEHSGGHRRIHLAPLRQLCRQPQTIIAWARAMPCAAANLATLPSHPRASNSAGGFGPWSEEEEG